MINGSCNMQLCTLLATYLYTVQTYIKASKVTETAFMLDATYQMCVHRPTKVHG